MKPTVSVNNTSSPSGILRLLVVGSRVAKSLSSASMPASVILLRKVDFPALVYPTMAITGIPSDILCFLSVSLELSTFSISLLSWLTLSLIALLSDSSFDSPGPLVPIPPPSLERFFPSPVSLEERYFN